ncbi:MAG: hypothetical protein ABRQ38_18450 [Candidatus Eremiobacterota bacterium]
MSEEKIVSEKIYGEPEDFKPWAKELGLESVTEAAKLYISDKAEAIVVDNISGEPAGNPWENLFDGKSHSVMKLMDEKGHDCKVAYFTTPDPKDSDHVTFKGFGGPAGDVWWQGEMFKKMEDGSLKYEIIIKGKAE